MARFHNIVVLTGAGLSAESDEAAGTKNLIHVHGELERALCAASRGRRISPSKCSARLAGKPPCAPTWWFGEMPREMERIYEALSRCDLFISIGTSGTV